MKKPEEHYCCFRFRSHFNMGIVHYHDENMNPQKYYLIFYYGEVENVFYAIEYCPFC